MSHQSVAARPAVSDLLDTVRTSSLYARAHAAPREFAIPVDGAKGTFRWVVMRGSSLNCERIQAWMEFVNPLLGRGALVTVDAPVIDCFVQRDGFGAPLVRIGTVSFYTTEHHAQTLEDVFAFGAIESDD